MREIRWETCVTERPVTALDAEEAALLQAAREVATGAYAPYSHFHVGAAVRLANGVVVTGSNQENAAYPSGLCAERVALFYAGARYPKVPVVALAVVALSGGQAVSSISPCGACRQVLAEAERRGACPIRILLGGAERVLTVPSAAALLPFAFTEENL